MSSTYIKKYLQFLNEMKTEDIKKLPKINTIDDVKWYEQKAKEKIRKAVTLLIAKHPIYSIPLLNFGIYLNWHLPSRTAATDYANIYFDPKFTLMLTEEELRFVLLHECLHIVYDHKSRKKGRQHKKWNRAADYAINRLLILDPLSRSNIIDMPKLDGEIFGLHDEQYKSLTAEQIYDKLDSSDEQDDDEQDDDGQGGDGQGGGGQESDGQESDGQESDGQESDGQNAEVEKIKQAQQKKRNDNDISGDINPEKAKQIKGGKFGQSDKPIDKSSLDKIQNDMKQSTQKNRGFLGQDLQNLILDTLSEKPKVDWRSKLKRYVKGMFKNKEYTESKRRFRPHKLNIAGNQKKRTRTVLKNLVIAVDVSGSVSTKDIETFIIEILDILKKFIVRKTTIYYVDAKISDENTDTFGRHGKPDLSKVGKGGGTDFHPPFNKMEEEKIIPDVFIYFTDGEASFPSKNYAQISKYKDKIFWCIVNENNSYRGPKPNYGHIIHINNNDLK